MTLRFWRRKQVFPGLRINLSKSGASVSIGRRGAWWTVGPRGRRMTVGAPGTGLFWTQRVAPSQPGRSGRRLAFLIAALFVLAALSIILAHP